MSVRLPACIGILVLSLELSGCGSSEVSFSSDVLPIFQKNCVQCHDEGGEGVSTSGFSIHDYDSVMRGTQFGPVVIPGSSASSSLYLVVAQKTAPEIHMPPHDTHAWAEGRGSPLSTDQVETIKNWIDQGAKNN